MPPQLAVKLLNTQLVLVQTKGVTATDHHHTPNCYCYSTTTYPLQKMPIMAKMLSMHLLLLLTNQRNLYNEDRIIRKKGYR